MIRALAVTVVALVAVSVAVVVAASPARADRASHGASFAVEPAVYPQRATCTTEPAPTTPIVRVLPAPRARLRLHVVGAGHLCRARWTAARAAPGSTELTLTAAADADAPSACGTCALDLLVTRLGRGDYRVTFDGATVRARAP